MESTFTWDGRARDYAEIGYDANEELWTFFRDDPEPHVAFINGILPRTSPTIRDRQIAEFIRRLAQIGLAILGRAEFPTVGLDEGYTCTLIIRAHASDEARIQQLWQEVYNEFGWDA